MPLKRRDIVRKVRAFGGWEDARRGKGGHRTLFRLDPANPEGRPLTTGLQYHGSNEDFPDSAVRAIRRRLKLTPEDGVSDERWENV